MTTETADPQDDQARMTLIDHLTELRRRLIICFVAVGLGTVVCWIFYLDIIDALLEPHCSGLPPGEECVLYNRAPFEPFSVKLSVSGYGGIAVSLPVLLWQMWRFVSPGLYKHEKRYAIPFIIVGTALFFMGAALAYWSLPRALEFFNDLGGDRIEPLLAPAEYISFAVKMILAFGIGFEFPLVLIFLQLTGVVENQTLRSSRQYAIVGVVALVAVITPSGDPFTLAVLSVPMYIFYEMAILFGRIRERRNRS